MSEAKFMKDIVFFRPTGYHSGKAQSCQSIPPVSIKKMDTKCSSFPYTAVLSKVEIRCKTPQQAMCKPTARRVNPLFGSNGKAICHHETTVGRAENPRKKSKFRPTIIILNTFF